MKIWAKVKPNSKEARVKEERGLFIVHVRAPAKEGKANEEVVDILSQHFKVSRSQITIKVGLKGKLKLIEIIHS